MWTELPFFLSIYRCISSPPPNVSTYPDSYYNDFKNLTNALNVIQPMLLLDGFDFHFAFKVNGYKYLTKALSCVSIIYVNVNKNKILINKQLVLIKLEEPPLASFHRHTEPNRRINTYG